MQNKSDSASDSPTDGFAALGLRPETLAALDDLGYEEPTPIQLKAIPPLIAGRDVLGQAATGTGKTAAFALPALEHITAGKGPATPVALVLVPTRELAMQVSEAMFKYGARLGVKVVPIYGGQPIFRQLQLLDRGVHVVVATPGRALDHIRRGSLPLDGIEVVVLDEADEMLDMGFSDDIKAILDATPAERQTVLFSATMPARINAIARRHQRDPIRIEIGKGDTTPPKVLVRQSAYVVSRAHKSAALARILDVEEPGAALVFCRTRTEVDQLTATMNGRGYRAEALHGGMDQAQRERVIGRLRDGAAELLVATDVAARGLDIDTLTHVVNYDVPSAAESYVHRIGRVGRAGREGVAITLAEPREQRLLANIERLTRQKISTESVPTVADMRARRLDQTVDSLRVALDANDLAEYNAVLEALSDEHDNRAIALAAIKIAHEVGGGSGDDVEIPDAAKRVDRATAPRAVAKKPAGKRGAAAPRPEESTGRSSPATAHIFIGLGRTSAIRPADLVGAIANESKLSGRQIGPIRIADNFSVVGVPEAKVEAVIAAMRATMIRGKKATVRRYTD